MTTLTQEVNQAAKDATVKSFDAASETFTFEEGQNGVTVNIDELTQQVEALLQEGGTGTVEVPVTETAYQVSTADLKANMKKLGKMCIRDSPRMIQTGPTGKSMLPAG